jgi:hypothetical protein
LLDIPCFHDAASPVFVSEWFLAFTGFCPPEKLLAKLGLKRGNGSCGA